MNSQETLPEVQITNVVTPIHERSDPKFKAGDKIKLKDDDREFEVDAVFSVTLPIPGQEDIGSDKQVWHYQVHIDRRDVREEDIAF